ncbi:MFS transporter [Brevibacillus fulvus]|uniref:DHA1 family multidrug resistance protein-like MFS transporter n=1 Tax=Brevibacillus fulvus TaxID=1125967 RepID=A0A939BST6_9BACL|nr:MFS transporter [Brevibacillus fulvus]MBM7588829.1 DHA1 family multidrug resistance protein-like MFS transporter [Brevibacillus fulvus]
MKWKRTLWILWAANFSITAGTNLVIPFLPYYIEHLGVHQLEDLERWSGWVFSAQFVTSFLFQPLWGRIADKHGRKIMLLRAALGMCVVTTLMGFVTAPWQLLALRLLNGVFSGFISMAVSLQASITPTEYSGRALGLLQTGGIAGSLLGPLFGGVLAEAVGYRNVFLFTGGLFFIASLVVFFLVHEEKKTADTTSKAAKMDWATIKPILPVFVASFITNLGMMSIEPIVTVYTRTIYHGGHLELVAGLVVAITGFANLIGAPTLGRLGDRIGQRKTLLIAMSMSALAFLPQAWATGIVVLLLGRFLLGLFVGGMVPSLNVLVKKMAPPNLLATAYGFNTSSLFLGNLIGPLMGSHVAAAFGLRTVFYVTMAILLLDALFIWFNRHLGEQPEWEAD